MIARHFTKVVLGAAALGLALPVLAQDVGVQVARGPHYAGDTIRVQVTATGFEEDPPPEVRVAPPKQGRLEFAGMSPTVSSSIRILNGQISRTKDVRFVYEYRYTAGPPGDASVGPFEVSQGVTVRRGSAVRLRIVPMSSSDDIGVRLILPESPVYVGARLPVVLTLEMTEAIEENLQSYSVQVPFFASSQAFRFLDSEPALGTGSGQNRFGPMDPGERKVKVSTGDGVIELSGTVSTRTRTRSGAPGVVVEISRTVVPMEPGVHAIPGSQLRVDEVTRWRRDLFGRPQAGQVRKLMAAAPSSEIRVDPVPLEGQPASFAGAVGRGFELEVTADRSVVAAGEPIELVLTLRGDGLSNAALPPLDVEGLLPPEDFRVPTDFLSGTVEDGAKRFTAVVRVLHEGVQEIPSLEYAWFDPEIEDYVVTRSRPIALSVGPSQRVGAADVQSPLAPELPSTQEAETPSGSPELGMAGADLAIERDPLKLAAIPPGVGNWRASWWIALYAISVAVVLGALWDSRRRGLDPVLAGRRRRLAAARQRVERAAVSGNEGEVAGEIASALREMIVESPDSRNAELDSFLGECDAQSFAPAGSARRMDEEFLVRALELARAIEEGNS